MISLTKNGKTIYELTGVPCAYMEISDGTKLVVISYTTVRYKGNWIQVQDAVETTLDEVFSLLPDGGIIFWRTILSFSSHEENGRIFWEAHMRFAVSPPLPQDFWDKHEVKEGRPSKELK